MIKNLTFSLYFLFPNISQNIIIKYYNNFYLYNKILFDIKVKNIDFLKSNYKEIILLFNKFIKDRIGYSFNKIKEFVGKYDDDE